MDQRTCTGYWIEQMCVALGKAARTGKCPNRSQKYKKAWTVMWVRRPGVWVCALYRGRIANSLKTAKTLEDARTIAWVRDSAHIKNRVMVWITQPQPGRHLSLFCSAWSVMNNGSICNRKLNILGTVLCLFRATLVVWAVSVLANSLGSKTSGCIPTACWKWSLALSNACTLLEIVWKNTQWPEPKVYLRE